MSFGWLVTIYGRITHTLCSSCGRRSAIKGDSRRQRSIAEILGIDRVSLWRKLKKYGLEE